MFVIARLVVVDRAETPTADSAWGIHCLESSAVFAAKVAIAISRITHIPSVVYCIKKALGINREPAQVKKDATGIFVSPKLCPLGQSNHIIICV